MLLNIILCTNLCFLRSQIMLVQRSNHENSININLDVDCLDMNVIV